MGKKAEILTRDRCDCEVGCIRPSVLWKTLNHVSSQLRLILMRTCIHSPMYKYPRFRFIGFHSGSHAINVRDCGGSRK